MKRQKNHPSSNGESDLPGLTAEQIRYWYSQLKRIGKQRKYPLPPPKPPKEWSKLTITGKQLYLANVMEWQWTVHLTSFKASPQMKRPSFKVVHKREAPGSGLPR